MVYLSLGTEVRLYDQEDDYFHSGRVTSVEKSHVGVEFAAVENEDGWIERFAFSDIDEGTEFGHEFWFTVERGEIVQIIPRDAKTMAA